MGANIRRTAMVDRGFGDLGGEAGALAGPRTDLGVFLSTSGALL